MRRSNVVRRALGVMLIAVMLITAAMPAFASSNKGSGAYVVDKIETGGERLIVHDAPFGDEVGRLKPGTVVVYKSNKSGWWKITCYYGTGWVDPKYLTSVTSLPSAKYVALKKLTVYPKAKAKSAYSVKLKTGVKVSIIDKSGDWVHIQVGWRHGWVQAKYLRRVS